MLGGLLVAAAAVIVFATAMGAAGRSGRPYVVAARALTAGSVIGPGDTTTQSMALPAGTRPLAFTDPAGLIGRRVAVAVGPGALIESPLLAPASGPAPRPVSVPVDTDSLAGLAPGQAVDVLELTSGAAAGAGQSGAGTTATGPAGSGPAGISVVLRGALLLDVSRSGSGLLPSSGAATVVTLGVSDLDQAEALVEAAHSGTVELVQAEPGDGTGPGTAAG